MSERTFASRGFRVGRLRGIDLCIHWTLLLWFAYVFYQEWVAGGPAGWRTFSYTAVWWAATFTTILIHEIGHCVFAFRQGGGADAIILWPLGGLAHCDAPRLPWNQFWVAAGGPLFQLVPTFLAAAALILLGGELTLSPQGNQNLLLEGLSAFFFWNVVLLGFNLLPLYPLDGGRIFQAVIWARLRSYGRASLITVYTTRVTALLVILGSFFLENPYRWPLLCILVWSVLSSERLRQQLQSGEEEDFVFGYDFSRGYTSLERTATRERPRARPSLLERLRTRSRSRKQLQETEIRKRVDALLERISREGMSSLSRRDRKFLEWAAKRLR